jgi:hypothetical protein
MRFVSTGFETSKQMKNGPMNEAYSDETINITELVPSNVIKNKQW